MSAAATFPPAVGFQTIRLAPAGAHCGGSYDDTRDILRKIVGNYRVVLIDTDLSVRRAAKLDATAMLKDAELWLTGKDIYTAQCAHCHGPDGRNDQYPGIHILHGIGHRISETEIIERTILSGNVDLHRFSDSEKRALGIFVAGL